MDRDGVAQAAPYMPLFPLIGAATGLIAGAVVWGLELVLPQLVAGMIGLGILILINGAQHVDGLLDFGDGIMFHGSASGKLRVMRDPATGAGRLLARPNYPGYSGTLDCSHTSTPDYPRSHRFRICCTVLNGSSGSQRQIRA